LTIHLISLHKSFEPWTSVYLASLSMNLLLSNSVFYRSVNSFFFSYSILWWSSRPYLFRWASRVRAVAFNVFVSISFLIIIIITSFKISQRSQANPRKNHSIITAKKEISILADNVMILKLLLTILVLRLSICELDS
jgi:hypothetical protein